MRASTSPQRVGMGENVDRACADAVVLEKESLRFKELIRKFRNFIFVWNAINFGFIGCV
jgi:hypothetical protein